MQKKSGHKLDDQIQKSKPSVYWKTRVMSPDTDWDDVHQKIRRFWRVGIAQPRMSRPYVQQPNKNHIL